MDMISLQGKTNFFEKRVSDYAKANVITSTVEGGHVSNRSLYVCYSYLYTIELVI